VPPAATPAPSSVPAGAGPIDSSFVARRRDPLVGVVLIVAAVAVGVWLWTRSVASLPRPPTSVTLLDRTLDLTGKSGDSPRLRIAEPCILEVTADTAARGLTVSFGPEQPVETEPRNTPDPALSSTWTTGTASDSHEVKAFGPGMYVLRVESGAVPAAEPVHIRVVERPWRSDPAGGGPVR
jgi:hypothetical protein